MYKCDLSIKIFAIILHRKSRIFLNQETFHTTCNIIKILHIGNIFQIYEVINYGTTLEKRIPLKMTPYKKSSYKPVWLSITGKLLYDFNRDYIQQYGFSSEQKQHMVSRGCHEHSAVQRFMVTFHVFGRVSSRFNRREEGGEGKKYIKIKMKMNEARVYFYQQKQTYHWLGVAQMR